MFGSIGNIVSKNKIALAVVTVSIIAVAVFVYYKYIRKSLYPKYIENNEYEQKDELSESVDLYLFYTTWCPHCKKAKPEWEKVKQEYDGKEVNGRIVYFKEVDCDKDEETASKFNVEGYPTVKLVKGSNIIEFDAKPTYETLKQFLEASV